MTILGVTFHPYGFIIGLAGILGFMAAEWQMKRLGRTITSPFVIVISCFALIGARAYHVMTDWTYYFPERLGEVFAVWNGGLGIFGAVIGGALGILVWNAWAKYREQTTYSLRAISDIAALSLPLAQSIGRWGNAVNQELYGLPTALPWGIPVDVSHRLPGFEQFERYHPLFLYESIPLFVLWIVLWKLSSGRWAVGTGKFAGVYFCLYGLLRFGVEFLRISPAMLGPISVAQWISLGLVPAGIFLYIGKRR